MMLIVEMSNDALVTFFNKNYHTLKEILGKAKHFVLSISKFAGSMWRKIVSTQFVYLAAV